MLYFSFFVENRLAQHWAPLGTPWHRRACELPCLGCTQGAVDILSENSWKKNRLAFLAFSGLGISWDILGFETQDIVGILLLLLDLLDLLDLLVQL